MKKIIKVTETDITAGNRGSLHYCPISWALIRAGFTEPSVHGDCFFAENLKKSISLPEKAKYFINKFDKGEKVRPIQFQIEI